LNNLSEIFFILGLMMFTSSRTHQLVPAPPQSLLLAPPQPLVPASPQPLVLDPPQPLVLALP